MFHDLLRSLFYKFESGAYMQCKNCNATIDADDDICVCGEPVTSHTTPPPESIPTKGGLFKAPATNGGLFAPPKAGDTTSNTTTDKPQKTGGLFKAPTANKVPAPTSSKVVTTKPATKKKGPSAVCNSCNANPAQIDEDGLCTNCGAQVVYAERDDFKVVAGENLALRSFLGKVHHRNEDCGVVFKVNEQDKDYVVLIVSDGVSSSQRAHLASEEACKAGRESIIQAISHGTRETKLLAERAIFAAQKAVEKIPLNGETNSLGQAKQAPQATFLVAVIDKQEQRGTCGWVGDCRAYLIANNQSSWDSQLLTKDHSWINLVVDAGEMSLEAAEADKRAHQIYQSLGRLYDDEELEPSYVDFSPAGSKYLLLTSDGFWNYGHPHQNLAAEPLLDELSLLSPGSNAMSIAENLMNFANNSGGHDNITVGVYIP
jgi:serine/threonine protein phosphatase PrpC